MSTRELIRGAIEDVAKRLGEDLPRVAIVGGTVAALYGDSELDLRPTDDVDVITDMTLPDYYALVARLKARGFRQCLDEGAPLCRLVCEPNLKVDVMPVNAGVLGFSNRWYPEALEHAESFALPSGLRVRAIAPVYFLATKLEAFKGRGNGDFAASHDLEDLVSLLGRVPALFDLVEAGGSPVARSVLKDLGGLSKTEAFIDAVPGYFLGDERAQEVAAAVTHRLLGLSRL